MARHRAIRNTKSYEYDDFDYEYGQSYEDDHYGVSPGTLAQYSYHRQTDVGLGQFIPSESTVQEENEQDVFESNDIKSTYHNGVPYNSKEKQFKENPALMNSCMEQINDAVGDHFTNKQIEATLRLFKFDIERSINHLLSSPDIKTVTSSTESDAPTSSSNLFFNEKPLEQRQSKNRRNDWNTNFNQEDNLSTKPKQPLINKTQVTTVKTTDKTPIKTGFDTSFQSPSQTFSTNVKDKKNTVSSDLFNTQRDTRPLNTLTNNVSNLVVNSSTTPSGKLIKGSTTKASVEEYKLSKKAVDISLKHQEHLKTTKPQFSLVVIGHVDAGKSTLMGHILYKCGEVSKKTMHKYEKDSKKLGKSSFAFAWVLDETEEERNRGVTMDVGVTKFDTEHTSIILLDAPGHKDFIPNMITGASQADIALLVINATTGEFEAGFDLGGQTREHSLLVRSLGVSQLAVAVNKLDTVEWSEKRFKEIVKKLQSFLKQVGFKENEVTYVPVSGLHGENLTEKSKDENLISWYHGPCLLKVLDSFKPPSRPVDYPFRFCVNDVYKGQGTGIQVSGKVETGGVSVGDKVIVLPAGESSLIKSIELQDNSKRDVAFAGDHVTLSCHGVDMMKIQTGNVISTIESPISVVSKFQARIIVFNTDLPITKGFSVELLYKASSEPAVIRKLINVLHKSTGDVQFKHPKMLLKGQNATVSIEVFRPICIEEYSKVKEMGRITLRYGGTTIAAGVVTKLLTNA